MCVIYMYAVIRALLLLHALVGFVRRHVPGTHSKRKYSGRLVFMFKCLNAPFYFHWEWWHAAQQAQYSSSHDARNTDKKGYYTK